MRSLVIEETAMTPKVYFAEGIHCISGRSVLEDNDNLYRQVINYLVLYGRSGNDLIFEFKLDYYNTLSLRYLIMMFYTFITIAKHAKVVIKWYYYSVDEDMEEVGLNFKEIYPNLKIKMIER